MKNKLQMLIILSFIFYTNLAVSQSKSKGEINKKIDILVNKIIESYQKLENAKYRNTIAIMDFEEKSKQAKGKLLGYGASELLTTRLSEIGIFNIVERKKIETLIDEISLGMTGLMNEETAAQAGKMVGADIIIIGNVSEMGNFFNLNVRLIEVESSTILVSTLVEIEKWLLISSADFIRPPKYRIGLALSWVSEVGSFVLIEYSRNLNEKIFYDINLGIGWSNLKNEEITIAEHIISGEKLLSLTNHINYNLINFKNISVSSFLGLSLTQLKYNYSWGFYTSADYFDKGSNSDKMIYLTIPFGISLNLYRLKDVAFKLDIGYNFSLNSLEKEFSNHPAPKYYIPPKLQVNLNGFILSGTIRMHF